MLPALLSLAVGRTASLLPPSHTPGKWQGKGVEGASFQTVSLTAIFQGDLPNLSIALHP